MSPSLINIGVVGATGMVGQTFIRILEQRKFPVGELKLFASQLSAGTQLSFRQKTYPIQVLEPGCFKNLDLVFFSSGEAISAEWVPRAIEDGAFAVDNSAAFRMDKEVPLIVPEVNGHLLPKPQKPIIIANPNCSTIQLVVVLAPLMKKFGLTQVQVASYQSVSGAGVAGNDELISQTLARLNNNPAPEAKTFPHPIAFTNIPQIGNFSSDGFCSEEIKIMQETCKILNHNTLAISAFTVRTPTLNSHSEAVWLTFEQEAQKNDIIQTLQRSAGIEVVDDPTNAQYPLNSTASDKDPVFVGRIHRDPSRAKTWMMWIVADNIRKGAALNGIQIAEQIFDIPR